MEFCAAQEFLIADKIPQPANRQVTVYNIGSNPSDELVPQHFGQIGYMLIRDTWMACCRDVYSRMDMALASRHFSSFGRHVHLCEKTES